MRGSSTPRRERSRCTAVRARAGCWSRATPTTHSFAPSRSTRSSWTCCGSGAKSGRPPRRSFEHPSSARIGIRLTMGREGIAKLGDHGIAGRVPGDHRGLRGRAGALPDRPGPAARRRTRRWCWPATRTTSARESAARLVLCGRGAAPDPHRRRAGAERQRREPARGGARPRRPAGGHPNGAGVAQHARVDARGAADPGAGGDPEPRRGHLALSPATGASGQPADAPGHRDRRADPPIRPAGSRRGGGRPGGTAGSSLGSTLKLAYYILRGWA